MNTFLVIVELLLIVAVLVQIVLAVTVKEKVKKFLAIKPVQRRCVILAFAAVATIGTTVSGLLAFGCVFGAALYDA